MVKNITKAKRALNETVLTNEHLYQKNVVMLRLSNV